MLLKFHTPNPLKSNPFPLTQRPSKLKPFNILYIYKWSNLHRSGGGDKTTKVKAAILLHCQPQSEPHGKEGN